MTLATELLDDWQPIHTLNGTKWVPTVISAGKCTGCPVYDECRLDVARGDFAWCERLIPADYELVNPKRTAYANYELKTGN